MLPVVAALALAVAPPPAVHLARLADLYRAYDLPLPPKDAKLVRYAPPGRNSPAPKPRIGFELSHRTDQDWGRVLFGCEWDAVTVPEAVSVVKPDPKEINPAELSLPTVLQMYRLGWHELALEVYTQGDNWKEWRPDYQLASRAFDHWQRRFLWAAADRAVVARRLALVLNGEPEAVGKERREWYDALLLSLKPTGAKPGSVEAAIDEMMDANRRGGWMECGDPRYFAVAARGFDAVPALLAHLSDARLTRFVTDGGGGFGNPRHCRIKHLTSGILKGFMDGDYPRDEDGEAKTDKDGVIRAKDVKAWWAKAEKEGEEAYAMRRVLGPEGDYNRQNKYLLKVIQHKYPHRLPELFYIVLADRPELELYDLAEAVAESTLPKKKKRELFAAAADSKNAGWRQDGRRYLRDVDPDGYRKRMLAAIASEQDYYLGWRFYEELIPCDDPEVWAAAEKYLKGADVSVRVEWLRRMADHDRPVATLPRRMAFVAAFLTDEAVRNEKATPAFFPDFPKIEVRNFAALQLGRMLDLKAKPKPEWTADEWKAFCERVAAAK